MAEDMMVNRFSWSRAGAIEAYERDGVYIIQDGHHRAAAAIEASEPSVPVNVTAVTSESQWTDLMIEVRESMEIR
ncbi:hypothetical protein [Chondromyces apiculatus]|uniref:hypothetical protein n=1 Tax=Chondromyces apiculatus TaxID=51 RepID=UPI0012DC8F8B|nr:hypothetical protein [Chondromyces apiculatus]